MARKRTSKQSKNRGCMGAVLGLIRILAKALVAITVGLFQLLASTAKWLNQQKVTLPIRGGYQISGLSVALLVSFLLTCGAIAFSWTNSQLHAVGILPTYTPTLTPTTIPTSTVTSSPTPTRIPTLVPTLTLEPAKVAFDVDIRTERGFIFVEIRTPYLEKHIAELFNKRIIPTSYDFPLNSKEAWPIDNKIVYPYFTSFAGPYPPAEYTVRITVDEQYWTFPFDIGQRVTQEELGDDWPFIPECSCGIVGCRWDAK